MHFARQQFQLLVQALLVGALAGQVGFGVLDALLQAQQHHYQGHAQQNQ
ncbi:hypothetical protein GCM10028821_22270 [Hymenobacter jeollabukensis]